MFEPDNNWVFFWGLWLNLLNTAIRETIHSFGTTATIVNGIGALVSFGAILGINYLGLFLAVCYKLCCTQKKRCFPVIIIVTQNTLVFSFYYIGDNLYPTLRAYGNSTIGGCDEQCQKSAQTASLAFLCMATFMLYFLTYCCSTISKIWEFEEKKKIWNKSLEVFVQVIKIDILYTTVIAIGSTYGLVRTDSNEASYCDNDSFRFGMAVVVITLVVIGFPTLFLASLKVKNIAEKETHMSVSKREVLCTFLFIGSCIILVLYILASNHLPLELALCGKDRGSQAYLDMMKTVSMTRFALSWTAFGIISIVGIYLIIQIGYVYSMMLCFLNRIFCGDED